MTKAEKINSILNDVQSIMEKVNPDKHWVITYGKPEECDFPISDFQRRLKEIRDGDEYFFIFNFEDGEQNLLYVKNVSAESVMFSLAELFDLLSYKF